MRSRLKLLRNAVIAAGIIAALGFGANEASGCLECDPPDDESCGQYRYPHVYCNNWCLNVQECYGGACGQHFMCECLEK